jgi:hypothetical protein
VADRQIDVIIGVALRAHGVYETTHPGDRELIEIELSVIYRTLRTKFNFRVDTNNVIHKIV